MPGQHSIRKSGTRKHLDGIHIMTSGDISKALKLIENL